MIGTLIALAVAAAQPAAPGVVGTYELQGQREVGSGLKLMPGGRFEWFLSYGALDEHATGSWRQSGRTVFLTSDQPIVAPAFTLVRSVAGPAGTLEIKVVGANGSGIALIDVEADIGTGEPLTGVTQDYGFRTDLPPGKKLVGLKMGLEMYGIPMQAFPVDGHNDLTYRFDANDLGKHDFRGEPVLIEPGAAVMNFHGEAMRYVKGSR
ncbi:hypothetical protein KX816_19460 [Sphingosinicellaceae bacterium]|nr:hypothetical protein KX816_19460 [Sphingosinicellaceae bacterium]